jgi:adenylate cyclase
MAGAIDMAEERVERRLSAILAADIAGYSALMGADEARTVRDLKGHQAVVLPMVGEFGGRIIDTAGDGILAEFPSVVNAVKCAVAIQSKMAERNSAIEPERRMQFRVGINIGDVVYDETRIYGDGINVAARLEGIAEAGGICISSKVYEEIRERIDLAYQDIGEQQLKNIARPVRAYWVRLDSIAAPTTAPALALPDKPSIAVLPFQNISGDPEQDYFCDGMVEDIITGLSRIRWLFVIARNSSFIYKGRAVDIKQIGRELGVRYVLEGSVRKAANRVRIAAQLIEANTGAHLWAEHYDRLLDDIFALQDEITMRVIGAIEPSLRKAEISRVKRQRPSNLNAYDLILRALPFVYTRMPKDAAMAIPLLEDGLKLEPDYGFAHALLSWCLHARFRRGGMHQEDRIAAIHHAHAAIAHGNYDATALAAAAHVIALEEHDTTTALKLFDCALELSNSNVFALSSSALILAWMGKTELAIERAQQALRLSPFDSLSFWPHHALAIAYFHTQRYEDAAGAARSAIDCNPGFSPPRTTLAAALMRLGRVEEAKAAARGVLEREPSWTIHGFLDYIGFEPAVFRPIADAWREAGLPE